MAGRRANKTHFCKRCKQNFKSTKDNPRKCTLCFSYNWKIEPKRISDRIKKNAKKNFDTVNADKEIVNGIRLQHLLTGEPMSTIATEILCESIPKVTDAELERLDSGQITAEELNAVVAERHAKEREQRVACV